MSYKSEAMFSRAFCRGLTERNIFYQRIESGETGRGIPDVYIRLKQREVWVELKNDYRISLHDPLFQIKWRPGQQAWHLKYKKAAGTHFCYTCVALKDGFILIPMRKRYLKNIVQSSDVWKFEKLADIFALIEGIGSEV